VALPKNYLDGVFTDPPYFDNVQYAELMDFCFSWLRLGLPGDPRFRPQSTRHPKELTGNDTLGRGLEHFADGLSTVFRQFAGALKPGAPFVFTYHHNDALAYLPIVISVLDANLTCTAALPAAAEMGASLHISGTASSTIDSVFVCRSVGAPVDDSTASVGLHRDLRAMRKAGVKIREGDVRCLLAGHLARLAVQRLRATWKPSLLLRARLQSAEDAIRELGVSERIDALLASQLSELTGRV
jgi:adenine-specific DNA methylase